MIQRHFNNETYQLQLDSHHRFAANWDATLIRMLHSCDAGEMSVITAYAPGFTMDDPTDGYSAFSLHTSAVVAMRHYQIRDEPGGDRMPVHGVRQLDRNSDKMVRPFESSAFSAHTAFSHGHYILNAGYSGEVDNTFSWEEPLQTYLSWKAGYTLYALHEQVVFHLWDRSFRPRFGDDAGSFSKQKQKQLNSNAKAGFFDNKTQGR